MSDARRKRREEERLDIKFASRVKSCIECEKFFVSCPIGDRCSDYWIRTRRKRGKK